MTIPVINNQYPYGQMTNSTISRLVGLHSSITRITEAIATASSGYTGVEGTQFEIQPSGPGINATVIPTLFGVTPSETPGEQGASYRYAFEQLNTQWQTFWTAALPYIEQLDNGQGTL